MKVIYWASYLCFWGLWGIFNFYAEGFFTTTFESYWLSVPLFVVSSLALALAGREVFKRVFHSMVKEDGRLPGW